MWKIVCLIVPVGLVAGIAGVFLVGCGEATAEATIDGSSKGACDRSVYRVSETLSGDQKEKFREALKTIQGKEFMKNRNEILKKREIPDEVYAAYCAKIDGKTAKEVIVMAEAIKRPAKMQAQLLKAFEVREAKFSLEKKFAVIKLTVHNGTKHTVAKAFFHVVLTTPDKSEPWLDKKNIMYTIPGEIEPDDTQTWILKFNLDRGWEKAPRDRDDLEFRATTTRIDDANGKLRE